MRVLYVVNSLWGGGTERSLAELFGPLGELGIEPAVVCLRRRSEGVEELVRSHGVPIHVIGAGRGARALAGLRRHVAIARPDLIHTSLFDADVLGRLAAVGTGVPVLSSLVNSSYEPERLLDPNVRRWSLEMARLIDGFTGRHLTAHFHAVSHSAARSATRRLKLDADRITVVERGRDAGRLGEPSAQRRLRSRAELGLAADDEVVVTVGRQEYQKDHLTLVRAVARLSGRKRLVVLLVGREGNASSALQGELSKLADRDQVRLLGHREDVPDVLAAADVFVLTSRYEGLPGAVIEALALGLPVVGSDIAPVSEVVEPGGNALLFPPGDAKALAAALAGLLDDPPRRAAMGLRSRAIFDQRFTLERSARRMADLYRQVAAGHPLPPRRLVA